MNGGLYFLSLTKSVVKQQVYSDPLKCITTLVCEQQEKLKELEQTSWFLTSSQT